MTLDAFIIKISAQADTVEFTDTMAIIDTHYQFKPIAFTNGNIHNAINQNNGSCKIFAFGLLHKLSKQQTLACFGRYYQYDVLHYPHGNDHQNIRQFIKTGWQGICFKGQALTPKHPPSE